MIEPDIFVVLAPVLEALENLGVRHHVGGSIASSVHGLRRTTRDADVVVDLRPEQVRPLVEALEQAYYVDEDMVREAQRCRASFNVIHLDTMLKVDLFVAKDGPFERGEMARARRVALEDMTLTVASPEDVVLRKLHWYRLGREASENQWNDIIGVLKVQTALDEAYMDRWAPHLGVADLLERARRDARLDL